MHIFFGLEPSFTPFWQLAQHHANDHLEGWSNELSKQSCNVHTKHSILTETTVPPFRQLRRVFTQPAPRASSNSCAQATAMWDTRCSPCLIKHHLSAACPVKSAEKHPCCCSRHDNTEPYWQRQLGDVPPAGYTAAVLQNLVVPMVMAAPPLAIRLGSDHATGSDLAQLL